MMAERHAITLAKVGTWPQRFMTHRLAGLDDVPRKITDQRLRRSAFRSVDESEQAIRQIR